MEIKKQTIKIYIQQLNSSELYTDIPIYLHSARTIQKVNVFIFRARVKGILYTIEIRKPCILFNFMTL